MKTIAMNWKCLLGLAALLGGLAPQAWAERSAPPATRSVRLFEIDRSLNSNLLCYEAELTEHGRFKATDPISAFWLMNAEDGRQEAMTWFEREHVYGFSVQMNPARTSLTLRIRALESRPVFVTLTHDGAQAEMEIAGHRAILSKVYVQTGHGLLPGVEWVKLIGVDPGSRAALQETLHP